MHEVTRRDDGLLADLHRLLAEGELPFGVIAKDIVLAVVGAMPIALGWGAGAGAELRQPMGVVIVGGLLFSQVMILFITPVVYLWFERLFAGRVLKSPRSVPPDANPAMGIDAV